MDNRTRIELERLRLALELDPRMQELSTLEKRVNEDPSIALASKEMKEKADAYGFALSHFGEESEETKRAQKALFEAKKRLDEIPLVREYNHAYSIIRSLYAEIDRILLDDFRFEVTCKGGKHA